MKKAINCCYKCEERVIGCHATCKKYAKFVEKNEKIKDQRRKDSRYADTSWAYLRSRNNGR